MRGLLKLRALLSSSILSAAVLAACTGAACSTAAGTTDDAALASKATLDTNDVSFLVPLPNTVDEPA
ncbi:MAG: hypothetical protein QOI41_1369, partial [Myxococcales bacterium]|nr:hypothetical protein [Myxococcales bacterium]